MIEKEGGGVGIQRPVFLEQTETGKNCNYEPIYHLYNYKEDNATGRR